MKLKNHDKGLRVRTTLKSGGVSVNHNDGLVLRTAPMLRAESQYEGTAMGLGKIIDLETHPEPYVTMSDLADYWRVTRKQVYKQVETGMLKATVLGPMLRISTIDAIRFEDRAMSPPAGRETSSHHLNGVVVINAADRAALQAIADGDDERSSASMSRSTARTEPLPRLTSIDRA